MRLCAETASGIEPATGQAYGSGTACRTSGSAIKEQGGFTLVELITIIVILGILAVAAIPRFFEKSVFDSRAFHDQVLSTLRFAQKTAIAQHATVCVVDTATEIGLYAADCTTPLNVLVAQRCVREGNDFRHKICAPDGVTISSGHGNLSFTPLGATPAPTRVYTVGGLDITVEAETGYVHGH